MSRKSFANSYSSGILAFCLALLFSACAFGQDIDPRITFLGGASLLSASRSFVIGPSVLATHFQNGIKIGVRGTFNVAEV